MKKVTILGAICLMLGLLCTAQAQKFENKFTKTAKFGANAKRKVLIIDNINGHVSVIGKKTDEVEVQVDQLIRADDKSELEKGKQELKFVVKEKGDTIFVYIDSPHIEHKQNGTRKWTNWNFHRVDYEFRYNITINAPNDIDLYASTVNQGDINIVGIHAQEIYAENVNGDVFLNDVTGKTRATTVNGTVEVDYKENPKGNCKYSTINGDVKIKYQKDLSANLKFKSMHGEFFTDFEIGGYLPTQIEKEAHDNGGTRFVVDKYTAVKIGGGQHSYKYETLNGDVYIIRK